MTTIQGSDRFYENGTEQEVQVTFLVKRLEGTKGSFSIHFEASVGRQEVTVPAKAEALFATGNVEARGGAKLVGLGSDEVVDVQLIKIH